MKDIAIFGAGGFGREVACLIKKINEFLENEDDRWNIIGFFDDNPNLLGLENEYGKVLGGKSKLNEWNSPLAVAIAIGNPQVYRKVQGSIINPLVSFPNLVAPDVTFYDEENVRLGKGNIICSHCLISCNVSIGDFNIFNDYTTIGHDAIIGDYNCLMPAVRVSGSVKMGNCNFCGVDSVILQGIKIGDDTKIGANSLIFQKTKGGHTYIGNPAYLLI